MNAKANAVSAVLKFAAHHNNGGAALMGAHLASEGTITAHALYVLRDVSRTLANRCNELVDAATTEGDSVATTTLEELARALEVFEAIRELLSDATPARHTDALALVAKWLPVLTSQGWPVGTVRLLAAVEGRGCSPVESIEPRGVVLPEGSRAVLVADATHDRPVLVIQRSDGSLDALDGPRVLTLANTDDGQVLALETAPNSQRFDVVRRRADDEPIVLDVAEGELSQWTATAVCC